MIGEPIELAPGDKPVMVTRRLRAAMTEMLERAQRDYPRLAGRPRGHLVAAGPNSAAPPPTLEVAEAEDEAEAVAKADRHAAKEKARQQAAEQGESAPEAARQRPAVPRSPQMGRAPQAVDVTSGQTFSSHPIAQSGVSRHPRPRALWHSDTARPRRALVLDRRRTRAWQRQRTPVRSRSVFPAHGNPAHRMRSGQQPDALGGGGRPGVSQSPPAAAVVEAAAPGAPAVRAGTAHNGLITARVFLDPGRTTSAIATVAPDGSSPHSTSSPSRPPAPATTTPNWSPDGPDDRLRPRHGRWQRPSLDGRRHRGEPQQLPQICQDGAPDCLNENESSPAFSPDGKLIAFGRDWGTVDDQQHQIQYSDLFVMNADGTNAQRLTMLTNDKPYSGTVRNPSWSPDGTAAPPSNTGRARAAQPADSTAIFVVNADGTGQRQLTPWALRAADRAELVTRRLTHPLHHLSDRPRVHTGRRDLHRPPGRQRRHRAHPGAVEQLLRARVLLARRTVHRLRPGPHRRGRRDLHHEERRLRRHPGVTNTPEQWESRPGWGPAAG